MPSDKPCRHGRIDEFVVHRLWDSKIFVAAAVCKCHLQSFRLVFKIGDCTGCYRLFVGIFIGLQCLGRNAHQKMVGFNDVLAFHLGLGSGFGRILKFIRVPTLHHVSVYCF